MSTDVRSFEDLGVDTAVIKALADAGITSPFPIQELSLPMALAGADLIGQARTGTGKTLAFGIPLVQRVDPDAGHTQALVIVPTRELCLQVHDDLTIAGATRHVQVVAAYGGRAIDPQSEAIAAGASIVVGTPGRLLDLCRRRMLDLSKVTALVLDEADEMLDMGFLPDVEQLIERCPDDRQTLLFSATMPSEVVKLARRYMDKPTFMRTDVEQQQQLAPQTRQHFFACHRLDKPAVVARILGAPGRGRTLIFTRTKRMADVLAAELRDRRIEAGVIHSDLRQDARERALGRFRKGTVDVLCATEVAARGLDIDDVTHVINYDCPDDERMYLHRIGRTGRAGADGVAITLAVWNELARLDMIKRSLDIDQPTHEVLSTSPMLDDLFGASGTSTTQRRSRREADTQRDDDGRSDDADAKETSDVTPAARPERRPRSRRRRQRRTTTSAGPARRRETGQEDADVTGTDGSVATRTEDATTQAEAATTQAEAATTGTAGDAAATDRASADGRPGTDDDARAGAATDMSSSSSTGAVDQASDSTDASSSGPAAGAAGQTDAAEPTRSAAADGSQPASSRSRRSGGSRRRRSRRSARRSGRDDTRRPSDDDRRDGGHDSTSSQRDADPRGEGRPTLNRPLRITHLP